MFFFFFFLMKYFSTINLSEHDELKYPASEKEKKNQSQIQGDSWLPVVSFEKDWCLSFSVALYSTSVPPERNILFGTLWTRCSTNSLFDAFWRLIRPKIWALIQWSSFVCCWHEAPKLLVSWTISIFFLNIGSLWKSASGLQGPTHECPPIMTNSSAQGFPRPRPPEVSELAAILGGKRGILFSFGLRTDSWLPLF